MSYPEASHALAYLVSRYPAVSHTFILREVQALRKLGFKIAVASINDPDRLPADMPLEERVEADQTYFIKRHGILGAAAALAWAGARSPLALARTLVHSVRFGKGLYGVAYAVEAAMVARWMHERQLQHLHVHFGNAAAAVGVLVKTLTQSRLTLTIHGPDEFDDVKGQQLAHKVAQADAVICISQFARSQLMRLSEPMHWAKLQLCRLGVYANDFACERGRHGRGAVRLLCVGRLTPAKGQILLLKACAMLRARSVPFHLTLVGDGPDRDILRGTIERLGLNSCVSMTGSLTPDQVRGELRQASVFVLPSLAEGIPVVLMEAMASGVPCVSTPVNGVPELIEHEKTGLLVTPGDEAALALQLQRLIEDEGMRQSLAQAGLQKVRRDFDLQRNVSHLADHHVRQAEFLEGRRMTARAEESLS